MQGDFGRVTFRATNGFTRVLAQQGRMLLESELNEQTAIHLHFLRTLIVDVVGACWRARDGFTLSAAAQGDDFLIAKGRLYVDGLLCEIDENVSFRTQPFFPPPGGAAIPESFLAVARVWERHLSASQRPDLREIALGGRDTASRAQIVWQVQLLDVDRIRGEAEALVRALDIRAHAPAPQPFPDPTALKTLLSGRAKTLTDALALAPDSKNAAVARDYLLAAAQVRPLLRARAKVDGHSLDPCAIDPGSDFRSRENQLYRVEVHRQGVGGEASFKWSRENASVTFRIHTVSASTSAEILVSVETLGRDRRSGLCEGDWVELTSDALEFSAAVLPLCRVKKIDRARRTLTLAKTGNAQYDGCTLLRRWDQNEHQPVGADGTIAVTESVDSKTWLPLERGVQIQFVAGGYYRTGDYWLVPARVESGDVIWPKEATGAQALPPDGVYLHRGVLGFGRKSPGEWSFLNTAFSLEPSAGDP